MASTPYTGIHFIYTYISEDMLKLVFVAFLEVSTVANEGEDGMGAFPRTSFFSQSRVCRHIQAEKSKWTHFFFCMPRPSECTISFQVLRVEAQWVR